METNTFVKKGQLIRLDLGVHDECTQSYYRALTDFNMKELVDSLPEGNPIDETIEGLMKHLIQTGSVEEFVIDLVMEIPCWPRSKFLKYLVDYNSDFAPVMRSEPVFKVDPNDPEPGRTLNLMAEQLNAPPIEFAPSANHPIFEYVKQREDGYNHLLTTLQWSVLRNRCLDYVARVIENCHTYDIRENIIVHPLVMDLLLGNGIWIDHDGFDDGGQAVHTFTNVYWTVYKESSKGVPTNSVVFDFSKETLFIFSSEDGRVDIKLLDNGGSFEVDSEFKEVVGRTYLNKLLKILSRVASRLNITQTERTNHPGKVSLTDEFLSTVLALSANAGASNDDFTAFGKELPVQLTLKYLELNKGK